MAHLTRGNPGSAGIRWQSPLSLCLNEISDNLSAHVSSRSAQSMSAFGVNVREDFVPYDDPFILLPGDQ